MKKSPFSRNGESATELLNLIHSDVYGSMSSPTRGGFQYFVTFIDDFSRYGYVYWMEHKIETFELFNIIKNEVQNQLGKNNKTLRSDRGGEYLSQEFIDYFRECGIVSKWNGVSEKRKQTLLVMVQFMMSQVGLPILF